MNSQRLLKFPVGLPRKTDHDVRSEREFRTGRDHQRRDLVGIMPGTVAAVHPAQARHPNPIAGADAHAAPAAMPPNSRIRPINSSSQSIGSIELSRSRANSVSSNISPHQPASERRFQPFLPVLVPSGPG